MEISKVLDFDALIERIRKPAEQSMDDMAEAQKAGAFSRELFSDASLALEFCMMAEFCHSHPDAVFSDVEVMDANSVKIKVPLDQMYHSYREWRLASVLSEQVAEAQQAEQDQNSQTEPGAANGTAH